MSTVQDKSAHTFFIPVMGTSFTIDAPLRIGRYGVSSVVSLTDDVLLEQMRKHHCQQAGEPYEEIPRKAEDSRARRVTAYLDLLDRILKKQVQELQASPFEAGSEITRYYDMLPDSDLKQRYQQMLATADVDEKLSLQTELRSCAVPGTIDVNIMTKLDRDMYRDGEILPAEFADAMSALRGYANSTIESSIIFSAGINHRLYGYIAQFEDFFPDAQGNIKKKIVLKVSDYRSSAIQARYLARRGLWVSEHRIESGLNCGGHAFASKGFVMGPILQEYKEKRSEYIETMLKALNKNFASNGRDTLTQAPDLLVTVQGGIGTAEENSLLKNYYNIDKTGWGTPFLLVPEVTHVDDEHLEKLQSASGDADVFLSDASPLGIPFWSLRYSASENRRREHIEAGKPGSPCPKSFLVKDTEFTKYPICHASSAFQKKKLPALAEGDYSPEQLERLKASVLAKACICDDLAGAALVKFDIDTTAAASICCGPNIVNFSKVASLEEMVKHIYGGESLMTNSARPHMFIKELSLYVEYLQKELEEFSLQLSSKTTKYFHEFKANLLNSIDYYVSTGKEYMLEAQDKFFSDLQQIRADIDSIILCDDTVEA